MSIVKTAFIGFGILATTTVTILLVTGGDNMPAYTTVAQNPDQKDYDNNSSIGKDYGWLLVDPFKPKNKHWWEWSFNNLKSSENSASDKFNKDKVETFYGDKTEQEGDAKSLNNICFHIFKSETSNTIKDTNSEEDKDKYNLGTDLWNYCSPLRTRPVTIEANKDQYEEGTIAHGKQGLASTANNVNEIFWILKSKWFYSLKSITEGHKFFKAFYDLNKDKDDKQSLKEACTAAYKTKSGQPSSLTTPDATETETYCIPKFSKA